MGGGTFGKGHKLPTRHQRGIIVTVLKTPAAPWLPISLSTSPAGDAVERYREPSEVRNQQVLTADPRSKETKEEAKSSRLEEVLLYPDKQPGPQKIHIVC